MNTLTIVYNRLQELQVQVDRLTEIVNTSDSMSSVRTAKSSLVFLTGLRDLNRQILVNLEKK